MYTVYFLELSPPPRANIYKCWNNIKKTLGKGGGDFSRKYSPLNLQGCDTFRKCCQLVQDLIFAEWIKHETLISQGKGDHVALGKNCTFSHSVQASDTF